jgi:diacylglycerol O-acyltransferase
MSAPLPRDRSPWCLELVDLTSGGSALVARFHHCLADGQALIALLGELADDLENGTPKRPIAPRSYGLDRPGGFLGRLVRLFRFMAMSADRARLLRRPMSGAKRATWSVSIPMDTVRSIARSRNHHVADVLLASVAGALRRYARDHGEAPRSIRALLPMVAPSMSSGDGLGNHYASVFVRLPILATDPLARLEMIARDTATRRSGRDLRMAIGLTRLAGAIAPALERWAVRWWARRASVVVSNLAGPTVPVRLAGHRVQSIVVWAPAAASIGLSVTFFGYAGALRVGVLADSSVIAQPEELVVGFQAAIDELAGGTLPDQP